MNFRWSLIKLTTILLCGVFLACCAAPAHTDNETTSMPLLEESVATICISDCAENDLSASDSLVPEDIPAAEIQEPKVPWYLTSRLIYHACGDVDGIRYTNSREAMDSTLAGGNMLVEVDFLFTEDGHLICGHKWKDILPEENDPKKQKKKGQPELPEVKCTLAEFLTRKIKGSYTGLTAADIISYMAEYPDLYIVVDTKEEDSTFVIAELLRLCAYQPDIADRFVIQLYDGGLKEQMLALYPFADDNFLFTCYKFDPARVQEILTICAEETLPVVTVPYGSWEQEAIDLFLEQGIYLFEHTVNSLEMADPSLQKGIYGFYTDSLRENELNPEYY